MKIVDWETSLAAFFDTRAEVPFAWGINDCLHFMLDGVEAMTGKQPWESPGASTAYEAARWLEALGGLQELFCVIAKNNSWAEVINPARNIQRGDVVLFEDQSRLCCGVAGVNVILCPGEKQLKGVSPGRAKIAFRIPTQEAPCPR